MAKSTRSGASFTPEELADPYPPEVVLRVTRAELGGESQSVGTNSSRSSKNEQQSGGRQISDPPVPAPMTGNPSNQSEVDPSSDASSTDGSGPTMDPDSTEDIEESEVDSTEESKPTRRQRKRAPRVTDVSDFDDF